MNVCARRERACETLREAVNNAAKQRKEREREREAGKGVYKPCAAKRTERRRNIRRRACVSTPLFFNSLGLLFVLNFSLSLSFSLLSNAVDFTDHLAYLLWLNQSRARGGHAKVAAALRGMRIARAEILPSPRRRLLHPVTSRGFSLSLSGRSFCTRISLALLPRKLIFSAGSLRRGDVSVFGVICTCVYI